MFNRINISKKYFAFWGVLVSIVPVLASAFSLEGSTFKTVIGEVVDVIYLIVPVLYVLSFLIFFWGLTVFIMNSDSASNIEKGKSYMIWGIAALFILVSVRVIIGLIATDLDIGPGAIIPLIPTK